MPGAPFQLPEDLKRANLGFFPTQAGFTAKQNLKLEFDSIGYRWELTDYFEMLPFPAASLNLDETTTATLEADILDTLFYANRNWMVVGTNPTQPARQTNGSIRLTQTDATGNSCHLIPAVNMGGVAAADSKLAVIDWRADREPAITAAFLSPVTVGADDFNVLIGFADDPTTPASSTDAAFLKISAVATVLTATLETYVAGVNTSVTVPLPSGAFDDSDLVKISVVISSETSSALVGRAKVYINNALTFESAVYLTANSGTTIQPFVGIDQTETGAGTAPNLDVFALRVGQNYKAL